METKQIGFPALVKKARKELIDSPLAGRYSRDNPESFVNLIAGGKEDVNAIIPLEAGLAVQPFNPKKRKHNEPAEPVKNNE